MIWLDAFHTFSFGKYACDVSDVSDISSRNPLSARFCVAVGLQNPVVTLGDISDVSPLASPNVTNVTYCHSTRMSETRGSNPRGPWVARANVTNVTNVTGVNRPIKADELEVEP